MAFDWSTVVSSAVVAVAALGGTIAGAGIARGQSESTERLSRERIAYERAESWRQEAADAWAATVALGDRLTIDSARDAVEAALASEEKIGASVLVRTAEQDFNDLRRTLGRTAALASPDDPVVEALLEVEAGLVKLWGVWIRYVVASAVYGPPKDQSALFRAGARLGLQPFENPATDGALGALLAAIQGDPGRGQAAGARETARNDEE